MGLLCGADISLAAAPPKPPLYFCVPATEIAAAGQECEDNDAFIDRGEDCLDKLDAEIKTATAAMKAAFSPDTVSQQSAKYQSSLQDYQQSSATLAYVIALNELAIREMDAYAGALAEPEDAEEADVNGGNRQRYDMSVTCFGETTRSIRSIQTDFRDRLRQLLAAKRGAAANAATSAADLQKIDAGSAGTAPAMGGKGQGSAAVNGGKSANGASDITGVQQDEQKPNAK